MQFTTCPVDRPSQRYIPAAMTTAPSMSLPAARGLKHLSFDQTTDEMAKELMPLLNLRRFGGGHIQTDIA